MKKISYLIISFLICRLLQAEHIYIAFLPFYILSLSSETEVPYLWEIPLACFACSVAEIAFYDDILVLIRVLIICGGVIIGFSSPKKLLWFFVAAALSLYLKNIYGAAFVWATVWSTLRKIFVKTYSTTKPSLLQEYKS